MLMEGLLWFDDHPTRPMADKIERAVQRYQKKFGHSPDICYIHESEATTQLKASDPKAKEDIKVLPAKSILPHHFWLGTQVNGKKAKGK